jgi:hypothetical protein
MYNRVLNSVFQDHIEANQYILCNDTYKYNFLHNLSFNPTSVYITLQYKSFMNGKIIIITFKFNWSMILQLILNKFYTPKKKKEQTKDSYNESLWCQC